MPPTYGLVVRFQLRPGAAEAFDELVDRTVEQISLHEPGTLVYTSHHVYGDPTVRVFYELYSDHDAFVAHERQAHIRRFLAERDDLIEGHTVDVLEDAAGKMPAAVLDAGVAGTAGVPGTSPAEVGERIRFYRKRAGLTQAAFGTEVERSVSWVSQVERGTRPIDRLSVLQRVADVLRVAVADLLGTDVVPLEDRPEAVEALRLALSGRPALDTLLLDAEQRPPSVPLDDLEADAEGVWGLVHAARYGELGPLLVSLLVELERTVRTATDDEAVRRGRELLTDCYQASAAMMAKLGENDAAWIAADRASRVAEDLQWPLAVAASAFRMAHVFLSLRQIPQAHKVAGEAEAALAARGRTRNEPEALSLQGGFLLVLAVASARENKRAQAHSYLEQARSIAEQVGAQRNDFGTEFGPANVSLHEVAIAVDLGDAGHAIDAAKQVDVAGLSPERQARMLMDLARAHMMRRQLGEAVRCLKQAEEITPEQTHNHETAHAIVRELLQLSGPRPQPELVDLADRFGIA